MAEHAKLRSPSRRRPDVLSAGALAVTVLAFVGPLTALLPFLVKGDTKRLSYPWRRIGSFLSLIGLAVVTAVTVAAWICLLGTAAGAGGARVPEEPR